MDEFFARNRLSAFIDGDLPEDEAAEVARAVELNPELRAEYEALVAASDFLRQHGGVPAPPGLHLSIMRRVDRLSVPRGRLAWVRGWIRRFSVESFAVGAVAVAVVVLLFVAPGDEAGQTVASGSSGQDPSESGPDAPPPGGEPVAEPAVAQAEPAEPGDGVNVDRDFQPLTEPAGFASSSATAGEADSSGASVDSRKSSPTEPAPSGGAGEDVARSFSKLEGHYVPAWDQEPEQLAGGTAASAGVEAQPESKKAVIASPFAFQLRPVDPGVLRDLPALAHALDGRLLGPDNAPLEPHSLTLEQNHARVVFQLPVTRITELEPALKRYGGVIRMEPPTGDLYSPNAVQIVVDVLYQP